MSRDRSFPYMTVDELAIAKAFDTYRIKTLDEGVIQPIKEHGLNGIDEALYAAWHKLCGTTQVQRGYLRDQLRSIENELSSRSEQPSESYRVLAATEAHPGLFWTLRHENAALKRARIRRMSDLMIPLSPGEKIILTEEKTFGFLENALSSLGDLGEFIKEKSYAIVGATLLAGTIYTGTNWSTTSSAYNQVANKYVRSGAIGRHALPLKREMTNHANSATIILTHTPRIVIHGKKSDFVIPEKDSNPHLGSMYASQMHQIIEAHLHPAVMEPLYLQQKELVVLNKLFIDSSASTQFTYTSLLLASDPKKTYLHEIAQLQMAAKNTKTASHILEKHMDQDLVHEEETSYDEMAFWKWLTIGLGIGTGLAGYNAIRQSQSEHYY